MYNYQYYKKFNYATTHTSNKKTPVFTNIIDYIWIGSNMDVKKTKSAFH